jgi:hypothetical protein
MIEPWQVPIIVMAVLAALTSVSWLISGALAGKSVVRSDGGRLARAAAVVRDYARTSSLAVPTVALGALALGFAGPDTLNRVTQVLTGVTAVIGAVVTVRTFQDERAARQGEGEQPPVAADGD